MRPEHTQSIPQTECESIETDFYEHTELRIISIGVICAFGEAAMLGQGHRELEKGAAHMGKEYGSFHRTSRREGNSLQLLSLRLAHQKPPFSLIAPDNII